MNIKEMKPIIEEYENEDFLGNCKFPMLEGMKILNRYWDSEEIYCEHDIFYHIQVEDTQEISIDEVSKLASMGWFIDDDSQCWSFIP